MGARALAPAACTAHARSRAAPAARAQRDKKLGKISKADATQQATEILSALQKLGDEARTEPASCVRLRASRNSRALRPRPKLSEDEVAFLQKHMSEGLAAFQTVTDGDATLKAR